LEELTFFLRNPGYFEKEANAIKQYQFGQSIEKLWNKSKSILKLINVREITAVFLVFDETLNFSQTFCEYIL